MSERVEGLHYSNLKFCEKLGEGGGGTVWRAEFIKPYKGYRVAAAKNIRDLRKEEIEILRKLQHPNIVRWIRSYSRGPVNIILIEYAPEGSLHDYLKDSNKPLSYELSFKWIKEATSAIEYLHDRHVLHRDIKARNCLLSRDLVLKLCDFGLACEIFQSQTISSQKGTYRYMAPELHVDQNGRALYSKPSDIYAYGMLIIEICARKPPFGKMDWYAVVYKVCKEGLQPDIPNGCPPMLASLAQRCWNVDPKKRPNIHNIKQELLASEGNPTHQLYQEGSSTESETWDLGQKVIVRNKGVSQRVDRVACFPSQPNQATKMVVSGGLNPVDPYIIDSDGYCRKELKSSDTAWQNQSDWGWVKCVAISPVSATIIVIREGRLLKVFDSHGNHLGSFFTLEEDKKSTTKVSLECAAIDATENVFVADSSRKIITVHKCPEGTLTGKIECRESITRMAVNSDSTVLYAHRPSKGTCDILQAVSHSGKELFTIKPKMDEDVSNKRVKIQGIACDATDRIYLVLSVWNQLNVCPHTGHIHLYSPTGAFMRCILRGVDNPSDLAMRSDGSLVVANQDSLLICSLA